MPPPQLVTVPISALQGLLAGAARDAAWRSAMLREAGIAPELLALDGARVTAAQYVALFSAVVDKLGDESLGHLARPLRPGSLALIARSTLGARTLGAALARMAEAFGLLQEEVALTPVAEGPLRGFALVFREADRARHNFCHELLLRVFWRLMAWLHGGRLRPRRFDFAFAEPPYAADYAGVFPAPLAFGAPHSAAWFDAAALDAPMRRDVHALQTFLQATPGNLVGPDLAGQSTTARLRSLLQRSSPQWLRLEDAAGCLHMSSSALQRRLAAEGTSFQALKDRLRRDMAIVLLATGRTPGEVAAELGFTDSTAFQRAFKAWTGHTPGTYRRPGP